MNRRHIHSICPLLVALLGCVGCHQRLADSIRCENAARLKLGQTEAQVRALLGDPPFVFEERAPATAERPATDTVWLYDISAPIPMVRDKFSLLFYEQRLVDVSAYRVYGAGVFKGAPQDALDLRYQLRDGMREEVRQVGPAFHDVFRCGQ